jgi:transcriptional regulator with XRE-family HTH domain
VDIGQRIRVARKSKGLTQKELGELINKSPQVISNWERAYTPSIGNEDLSLLANALDIAITDLMESKAITEPVNRGNKKPKDLIRILEKEEFTLNGQMATQEDRDRLLKMIEAMYWDAKEKNKRK